MNTNVDNQQALLHPFINPATEEILGHVRENSSGDVFKAIETSRKAQKEWQKFTFRVRAAFLLKVRDYIVKNAEPIAVTIAKSTGKTRMDALSTEVLSAAMAINYYAKNAEKFLGRKRISAGSILTINKRSYMDRVPLGVVGIISPWNYPFAIPFHEVAMALIAGNGVILKVASQTPLVCAAIRDSINAGGFPDGLFHLLNLPGPKAGDAFIESGINKLFFTGSVSVGKKLMAKAAEKLIPVSLELGGNDAMIVCDDADIERAVNGALWAGLSNCGQSCAAVERIFVEEPVYTKFIELLKKKMISLRQGEDKNYEVEIGSLTTKQQKENILQYVVDAKKKGATSFPVEVKSITDTKGYFYPPLILENVDSRMHVMEEEILGPLLSVQKVRTLDEAVNEANSSSLGLAASIWTRNKKKAHETAAKLEVGSVMINDHLMSHGLAETPWGGFKDSGIGRTHSFLGLEEMTQPRVVIDDILPGIKKNMWWYPHNKKVFNGVLGALDLLYSDNLGGKLRGLVRLIPVFLRSFKS